MTETAEFPLDGAVMTAESPVSKTRKRSGKISEDIVITETMTTLNGYFKLATGTFKILEHNIRKGINTLLVGPTGQGKTEMVSNMAKVMNVPLTILDMGTMTDPVMGLVGTHVITVKDGKSYSEFRRSRFSELIQNPGIILCDEISRSAAMSNNLLFPCLDFRRELSMEYAFDDTEPVKVHSKCVFFATANIGSQYTGTHKLDRALVDRFMMITVDPLDEINLAQSLSVTHPALKSEKATKIVKVYYKINKEHNEFKISFNLSMRHLKTICTLVCNGFTIYDSYHAICKGIGGVEGLKAVQTILDTEKT